MDLNDGVLEETSETEYERNNLPVEFQQMESQITELEAQFSADNTELHNKLQEALSLLNLHIQSYQRIVITRRRRAKHFFRKRQTTLRNCFMQMMLDMQVCFMEMMPLELNPFVFEEKLKEKSEECIKKLNTEDINDTAPPASQANNRVDFFEDIVSNFTEEQWLDTFHMTKKAFLLICSRLKHILLTTSMSVESLMAMCIYAMATGSTFRSVGMLFNKPQTYVRSALYKFVQAFLRIFEKNFLSMPNRARSVSKICDGFAKVSGLPPCVLGVLSIFELPIFAYTRPGFKPYGMDRVIVQALIDDSLLFRKVQVSHKKPSLFLNAPNELTNIPPRILGSTALIHFVVAPPHYPLRSWLMQRYDEPHEQYEHDFNQSLQQINIFRNVALQRLFGRWQILSSSEFIEPESKSLIAKACCTLHNLLEECDELYSEEWSDNVDLSKYEYKEDEDDEEKPPAPSDSNDKELMCGKKMRDRVAQLLKPPKEKYACGEKG